MGMWVDAIMVFLILTNLALLGASRIAFCVRVVAAQGLVLSLLPLLAGVHGITFRALLLAGVALTGQGVVFPWLLFRALRDANVRNEVEPFVGYTLSLAAGVAALAVFLGLSGRIQFPFPAASTLMVPVALFMSFTGLFLVMTRKKALSQVLGYLVLENGIYIFGAALVNEQPWLVELGILLDVFVAVFVMGIIIFHISREFDHIDTHRMAFLRDWKRAKQPDHPLDEGEDRL